MSVSLKKLTRADCDAEMTAAEVRSIQLRMLRTFADFCEENGLRYFLSSGTLLGAVRHQGFIPWDDDIDLNMPRPDCEKLLALSEGEIGPYVFTGPDMDGFCPICECFRLYSPDAVIESWAAGYAREPYYYPVFIDVFPIEGLPDGMLQTRLHYYRILFARKMQRISILKHMEARSFAAHIFHVIAWIPAKLVGYRKWSELVQKIATKYSFEDCDWVGVMTTPAQTIAEKVRKADYLKQIPVTFENEIYHAPSNYDIYLRQLYGDYMTPPPANKRRSDHVFHVFRVKEMG